MFVLMWMMLCMVCVLLEMVCDLSKFCLSAFVVSMVVVGFVFGLLMSMDVGKLVVMCVGMMLCSVSVNVLN